MATSDTAQFPAKLKFLFQPKRWKVAYGGRGAAKSWGFARALLILGAARPLRIICARETQKSLADSVYQLLCDQIRALGLETFYSVTKTNILGANGTSFSFVGIRQSSVADIKSFEGADICWVEEAQVVSKHSWDILIPTIRKDNSEVWVSFNPELETDDTYQRFVVSPPPTEMATVVKINWRDNPWFPQTLKNEMLALKERDSESYEHIYEGICQAVVEGAIYRNELIAAEKEGRITRVPYDAAKPVDTFWDLGFGDNTSIWFAQSIGFEFRMVDFVNDSLKDIGFYLKTLQERGYVYGTHFLPHDARQKQLAAGGRTIQQQVAAQYPSRVEVVQVGSIQGGIDACRAIFNRCWFDAMKCSDGLQALRHYRYEFDEELRTYKKQPLHDWASHPADAFRTLAVAIQEHKAKAAPAKAEAMGDLAWMG